MGFLGGGGDSYSNMSILACYMWNADYFEFSSDCSLVRVRYVGPLLVLVVKNTARLKASVDGRD